jgi:hypothetical protein
MCTCFLKLFLIVGLVLSASTAQAEVSSSVNATTGAVEFKFGNTVQQFLYPNGNLTANGTVAGSNLTASQNVNGQFLNASKFLKLTPQALSGSCTNGHIGINSANNDPYYCKAGVWSPFVAPPNTTINPTTTCSGTNYLQWNGTSFTCTMPTPCASGQLLIGNTCYVIPACGANTVLTFNGSALGCTAPAMNCPANYVLSGINANGTPNCVVHQGESSSGPAVSGNCEWELNRLGDFVCRALSPATCGLYRPMCNCPTGYSAMVSGSNTLGSTTICFRN